jgi:hypothetical protein
MEQGRDKVRAVKISSSVCEQVGQSTRHKTQRSVRLSPSILSFSVSRSLTISLSQSVASLHPFPLFHAHNTAQ